MKNQALVHTRPVAPHNPANSGVDQPIPEGKEMPESGPADNVAEQNCRQLAANQQLQTITDRAR